MAQARLLALYRVKRLDRRYQHGRDTVWVPWRSRTGDLAHHLAVAQAWVDLGTPSEFATEYVIDGLRPDALFYIGSQAFFLEAERSHNSTQRKMQAYHDLWRGGAWRDRFPAWPHLLLVVPSPAHVARAEGIPSPPKTVCTPSQVAQAASLAYTAAKSSQAQSLSSQSRPSRQP